MFIKDPPAEIYHLLLYYIFVGIARVKFKSKKIYRRLYFYRKILGFKDFLIFDDI